MLEWGSFVVRHQSGAMLRGHLRDKRGGLGSMGEEPCQGKNFRWEPGYGASGYHS